MLNLSDLEEISSITASEYNVKTINSIADLYEDLRQDSKGPTFLLQYQGTKEALMTQCGFSEEEAVSIENNYHELYVETDKWLKEKLDQAAVDGYVTGAFGHRVRTPVLAQSVRGSRAALQAAQKEARTAGNALGQSYGLLNNRAANELWDRLIESEHMLDILPCCHIHDAQYFMVKNEPKALKWLNDNLIECMSWQELEEIQHDEVKLGASLEIFFPSWASSTKVPNSATLEEITDILQGLQDG